jgi:hypothetical protein
MRRVTNPQVQLRHQRRKDGGTFNLAQIVPRGSPLSHSNPPDKVRGADEPEGHLHVTWLATNTGGSTGYAKMLLAESPENIFVETLSPVAIIEPDTPTEVFMNWPIPVDFPLGPRELAIGFYQTDSTGTTGPEGGEPIALASHITTPIINDPVTPATIVPSANDADIIIE